MAVSNFETIVAECSSQIECTLARFDLAICVGIRSGTRPGKENDAKESQPTIHFAIVLLSISSMTFPTASFTFRTSSTVGALPAGKETSF